MNDTIQEQAPPDLSPTKVLRMLNVNEVRLSGRLTHDPEIRSVIGDKMIVHLNLALNRPYQSKVGKGRQEVTFVPVTLWDSRAADTTQHLRRGNPVYVEGRLRSDRWKTSTGQIRSVLRVEAAKLQFLAAEA
jgi:single-strand DNA-binding protein